MPIVLWYSKLQPGVTPEVYERWVREVDYVGAAQIESLISYRVHRIQGTFVGERPFDYDYIEIAEITNMDDYMRDLDEHPAAKRIVAEIGDYIESVGSAWGFSVAR